MSFCHVYFNALHCFAHFKLHMSFCVQAPQFRHQSKCHRSGRAHIHLFSCCLHIPSPHITHNQPNYFTVATIRFLVFTMAQLSSRALKNAEPKEMFKLMGAVFSNPYSESNPDGVVFMGLAENKLMCLYHFSSTLLLLRETTKADDEDQAHRDSRLHQQACYR